MAHRKQEKQLHQDFIELNQMEQRTMNITYDVIKTAGYSGNLTYTKDLISALALHFPDNRYRLLTQLNKKKDVAAFFGKNNSFEYRNILLNDRMLGEKNRPYFQAINLSVLRKAARHTDMYHATNPSHFPEGIKNGVVTLHDLIALLPESWAADDSKTFYHKKISNILQQAKLVFTVSEFTRSDALHYFPNYADKYVATPLAANPAFRQISSNRSFLLRYGVADPLKPYLLYVGEIQPRKNIEGMLRAFENLPPALQKELQIIIVGHAKRQENLSLFHKALNGMKSRAPVYHLRNVPLPDLVQLYNAAHAFVYLSFYEGFGLPVIEAMSCGCPVLTSRTTSLGEVAADAALTANPRNHEEITDALKQLLDDNETRTKLIEKGLLRAQEFSWKKTATKTMEGYRLASSV
ncbi:MAG: glycosyltransferase family 4 protein [Chlorobiaceae bacterium]|nr:glycosyltransferase family 4 protein [Chlorobiaceae bacterium]